MIGKRFMEPVMRPVRSAANMALLALCVAVAALLFVIAR